MLMKVLTLFIALIRLKEKAIKHITAQNGSSISSQAISYGQINCKYIVLFLKYLGCFGDILYYVI